LLGTEESLKKMKNGNILLVPSKEEWKSDTLFAVLASRKGSLYQRIGLVELHREASSEILEGLKKEKITISLSAVQGSKDKQIEREIQTNIEVEPK
jgi:hypothetical protein